MPDHPKVVWGKGASEHRDWFNKYQARKLLQKPKTEEQEAERRRLPGVLTDPQGHIIRTRLRRLHGDIAKVSQHLVLRRLSLSDYIAYAQREVERMVRSVAAMSSLRLTRQQTRKAAISVRDTIARVLQGHQEGKYPMGLALELAKIVTDEIEALLTGRRAEPAVKKAEEKISESGRNNLSEYGPFLENKVRALGLKMEDLPGLIATARHMGVDVDAILAKLRRGEDPEELRELLGA